MCKVARISAIIVVWMVFLLIPQPNGEKKFTDSWMEANRDAMR